RAARFPCSFGAVGRRPAGRPAGARGTTGRAGCRGDAASLVAPARSHPTDRTGLVADRRWPCAAPERLLSAEHPVGGGGGALARAGTRVSRRSWATGVRP